MLSLSDIVNVKVGIGRGVFEAPGATVIGGKKPSFNLEILKLFANNEQGFFYDPNDLSTMYRDAAGTVPVTGAGQAVGLILDKSKGLVLGSEVVANGGFDTNTNWVLTSGLSISGGKLNIVASVGGAATQILGSYKPSGWYEIRLKVDTVTSSDFTVRLLSTSSTIVGSGTYKNTAGGHIWKVLADAPFDRVVIQCGGGAGLTATIDSISVKELAGNHAYQTTSASRPLLQKDAITGAYYLEFDGSDDFLQTSDIDFTGTDKVSLFAGARKLRESTSILVELSRSLNSYKGTFYILVSDGSSSNFRFSSKGTLPIYGANATSSGHASPFSAVLSAKGDISTDYAEIRVNGLKTIAPFIDQGTGNYGNYPLYIGRRSDTTYPFSGHIYGLIGIGKLTSDTETMALEKLIAKRVGVTLSV